MPAERSWHARRSQTDGEGFMWTLPVEPLGESGIGFAPTLTEDAFADLPPLVGAPDTPVSPVSPCNSFIFADEYTPSTGVPARRSVHTRKKSDNHIPRPPNAFILFRSSFIKSQRVSTEVETNHSTLSKIIGLTWKNLSEDEREIWRRKAMEAVAEHKRNFPSYAFRPKCSRGKKGDPDGVHHKPKRKVREIYQDPRRCEKIAELLVEGKTGTELDRAIHEFDKHHVPQIVTRFEAPITARAYRRSSSVPAPNSDDARGFLSSTPASFESSACRGGRRSSSVGASARTSQEQITAQQTRSASISVNTDVDGSGQATPVSFDSFSFPFKKEPDADFDFSSFSFSNVTSPASSVGYDPLSPLSPCSPFKASTFDYKLEPLSPASIMPVEPIDVSAFIANEWLLHGDSANPFGGYPTVDYSVPAFAFPPSVYSMTASGPGFCSSFKNLAFEDQSYCTPQEASAGLAQLEAEMASFMAQYSL
ncbi:hypothetical protein GGX14DRAFT_510556 [Mycena pura]|uniref:HMG box domain-containing protein n=1 Tax=Mycena pura TaxID=153505 RepID=A0AAD6YRG4_9AGAR|nr:hypothetical protein GGX14DRAFT_510556 [Mycena pura]